MKHHTKITPRKFSGQNFFDVKIINGFYYIIPHYAIIEPLERELINNGKQKPAS